MKKAILGFMLLAGLWSHAEDSAKSPTEKASVKQLSAVRKVVKGHLLEVQKCYTDLIIEHMEMRGKVVVGWDVDEKGSAQNITVKENSANDPALAGCVTEKLQNWGFPMADAGRLYEVDYPFKFGN